MTERLWFGGPGNKADRARAAALSPALQVLASHLAETLYDGTRTVARCWKEALTWAEGQQGVSDGIQ